MLSIVFVFKNKTLYSKVLSAFFIFLLLIEVLCYNIQQTNVVYNFWYPIEFTFYCYAVGHVMNYSQKNKLMGLPFILVVVCYFHYAKNWTDINVFYTLGYNLFVVALFIFVVIKLYELLIDESELRFPFKIPLFWLLLGLVFDLTSVLLFGMKNYIFTANFGLYIFLQHANQLFSSLQYICFIIYFYCTWKYQNWIL